MIYYITLKNKTYEVEVEDGEAVLLSETDNGEAPAAPKGGSAPKKAAAPVRAAVPVPAAAAPAPAPAFSAPAAVPAEAGAVVSPMPGSILNLCVIEGQQVAAGDVVLILEAMKMENEIVATSSGVVQKILVTKGQSVQTGTPLVVIG